MQFAIYSFSFFTWPHLCIVLIFHSVSMSPIDELRNARRRPQFARIDAALGGQKCGTSICPPSAASMRTNRANASNCATHLTLHFIDLLAIVIALHWTGSFFPC